MADTQYERLTGDSDAWGQLQAKGQAFRDLAATIKASVASLQAITEDDQTVSEAMTELRDLAGTVKADIEATSLLYDKVGGAITGYRAQLETAKAVADPAAAEIDRLQSEQSLAATTVSDAESALATARRNLRNERWWGGDDQEEVDRLQRKVDQRQRALDQAVSSQQDVDEAIDRQRRLWRNNDGHGGGKELKDTAADQAAGAIDSVFDDPQVSHLEDSIWDKAKELWDSVYQVISTICDLAGILAIFLSWVPVLGEVLAVLAVVPRGVPTLCW